MNEVYDTGSVIHSFKITETGAQLVPLGVVPTNGGAGMGQYSFLLGIYEHRYQL